MTKRMFTILNVYFASMYWYGSTGIEHCCLAENRLMRGELPYEGF